MLPSWGTLRKKGKAEEEPGRLAASLVNDVLCVPWKWFLEFEQVGGTVPSRIRPSPCRVTYVAGMGFLVLRNEMSLWEDAKERENHAPS